MPPGHLDLLLDQIKIVEQPIGGVCHPAVRVNGQRFPVECLEDFGVMLEALQQAVCAVPGRDPMAGSQGFGMGNQLVEAE